MIHIKEVTANDIAYTDGGAQVEFSRSQFGGLWEAGDVTISVSYEGASASSVITIPEQGNFYAREYSRRNGNRSPLKEFFKEVLKLSKKDIGTLLIFEDKTGRGKNFEIYTYRPRMKKTGDEPVDVISPAPADYAKFLRALRTKPFLLLAGISGTGKSRIVRELAFKSCPEGLRDADGTTPGNYCMIEVKPNWHDSSELLGYYSNISKQYRFTKFISFLVKAMMFPNVPFFVCLDEMNLAPVEQYFAEFLSILETRKKTEEGIQTGILVSASNFLNVCNGEETEDGIIALRFFPNLCWIENQIYSQKKLTTQGLSLPDNVFIIGTVNMDDTTHQFSRKVIDRAMTIEMNGGNLKDMFGGSRNLDYLPSSDVWPIELFKPRFVSADEVLSAYPQYAEFIQTILPEKLDGINQVLQGTPFQVSYRVLNEMVIYLSVLLGDGITFNDAVDQTIDRIMLMKILPRIEGDRELLMANSQISRLEKLMAFATLDETKQKLKEMNERLVKQDFTRFWP